MIKFSKNNFGFTILEILISLAIFSIILLFVISFFFTMNTSNLKTKNNREVLESTRRVLDEIAFEIKSAESIYTPTTTANQLSLKTTRYLPSNESTTFIDFFLCGDAICFKKEFQDPVALTPNSVRITSLEFLKIMNGTVPSIKINITVNYIGADSADMNSSVNFTTTASLRSGTLITETISNPPTSGNVWFRQLQSDNDGVYRNFNQLQTSAEPESYSVRCIKNSTLSCGEDFTDSRDNKVYGTALIGSQCWMAQNLNIGTQIDVSVYQGTSCSSIQKYCPNNGEANCATYGGLYEWKQAMCNSSVSGTQGICPVGWHIPTHGEWTDLERSICISGTCATDFPYDTTTIFWRGTNEGLKLKSGGTSGFDALFAGSCNAATPGCSGIGVYGAFFTSTLINL